jgi:hypothetical protein
MRARRAATTPRRSLEASGPGSRPGPSRGITSTSAITATDSAAGSAVSSSERSGPMSPDAISVPSTATATKLTELLMRKNATERRAMRSTGIPPRCRIHAPSARPPAPLAGRSDPAASSDHAICALVRHDIRRQKIGRNMSKYEPHDNASSATASASQPGAASPSLSLTSPRPGANSTTSSRTPTSATTCNSRRNRRRGASSSGSASAPPVASASARNIRAVRAGTLKQSSLAATCTLLSGRSELALACHRAACSQRSRTRCRGRSSPLAGRSAK